MVSTGQAVFVVCALALAQGLSVSSLPEYPPFEDPVQDGNIRWAESASEKLMEMGIQAPGTAADNFCSDGKLLPSFYLLGGPKCATTTVSMELGRYGGVRAAPQLWSKKEWHFWEKYTPGASVEIVRKAFRDSLGQCPEQRLVLGDFSINNLAAVPAPKEMDITPCSCKPSLRASRRSTNGGDVPRLLSEVYGQNKSRVTLMMMIRSPLSRIQSSWYHAKAENFSAYWGFHDCCTASFQNALQTIINASDMTKEPPAFKGKLGGEGSVWTSLFGRHLEAYLKYFNASQMLIVPYKQFLNLDTKIPICTELRNRLNIGLNCTNHEEFHENVHPHPPLEQDVKHEVRNLLWRMFEPETRRLVDALAIANRGGAMMAGYKGSVGAHDQIESWLKANW